MVCRVGVWCPLAVIDKRFVFVVYGRQHRLVEVSFSGGFAKFHKDVCIENRLLFDPPFEFRLVRGKMAHRGATNNLTIGFQDVRGQHRPHIVRWAEVSTKDPAVVGPIDWRVDEQYPLVPAELTQVADVSSGAHQLGLRDQPIEVVDGEGTVGPDS